MSRYRETTNVWTRYADITVDNRGGSVGSTNVLAVIPKDFDEFWLNVQPDADDIRVIDPDGFTLVTYDVKDAAGTGTFSKTNRDGSVRVTWSAPATAMCRLVLAWGLGSVSSGAGSPSTSSQKTGYIATTRPTRVVVAGPARLGTTRPEVGIQKSSTETIRVAFDVAGLLDRRSAKHAGGYEGDALSYASYTVDAASVAVPAMVDASSVRFHWPSLVSFLVQAGFSGTEYTINPTLTTKNAQVLNPRARVKVQNLVE